MIIINPPVEQVNAIANDPAVYAPMMLGMLHPQADMDFTDAVEHSNTVTLMEDGFCALFVWTSPATYECHVMARKSARGVQMMRSARAMLQIMKDKGAKRIWGQPSAYNKPAVCFVRRMGLRYLDTGFHPIAGDVLYFETEL